ncbi:hypothetical protein M9H77_07329 [Catharanthus roseus]|uniref:Uncharacterized protein n=1 Tax=Catharanthus roseus TaxID=4058 RepID=A0ACC0BUV8_CATRO|nr:hypothetical protein M9H77_07329 [Catharanthus roseus]
MDLGLVPAAEELLPKMEHRFCVRHLHNNFKKVHPGNALKHNLWRCAKCCHPNQFMDNMEALKLPGRPKKLRRREPDEVAGGSKPGLKKLRKAGRVAVKCRICFQNGHNARKCPGKQGNQQRSVAEGENQAESVVEPSNMIKCGNCGEFGHNKRTCKPQSQEVTEDNGDEMLAENHPNTDFSDIEEMDILYWLQMQHNKLRFKCKLQVDNGDKMPAENQSNSQISQVVTEKANEEDKIMANSETQQSSQVSNPVLPENEQPSAQMPTNRNQQSKKGRTSVSYGSPWKVDMYIFE